MSSWYYKPIYLDDIYRSLWCKTYIFNLNRKTFFLIRFGNNSDKVKRLERTDLKLLQGLSLDLKIARTERRIREWIYYNGLENVYLSFSGGKDSTVLLHILRNRMNIDILPVFSNTRNENISIINHIKKVEGVEWITPKMFLKEIIIKYGYPVVSKDISSKIYKLRNQNLTDEYKNYLLNGDERGNFGTIPKKWQYLINADFNISNFCCEKLKKVAFKEFEKKTGRVPITGEIAEESRDRTESYLKYGCNAFARKQGLKSTPLGFWTNNDILQYIVENDVDIADCYGDIVIDYYETKGGKKRAVYKTTKEARTGCVACCYGVQYEEAHNNRFTRLRKENRRYYDYIMGGGEYNDKGIWIPNNEGLGFNHVLNYMGISH